MSESDTKNVLADDNVKPQNELVETIGEKAEPARSVEQATAAPKRQSTGGPKFTPRSRVRGGGDMSHARWTQRLNAAFKPDRRRR
jgi:hypothetical protein